jgi:CHAT domain
MRVSLLKDNQESETGEIRVHVKVSERDDPPAWVDSHSFVYNVHSGGGNITIYTTARDLHEECSFGPEECLNMDGKQCNDKGCPIISGKTKRQRILVTDVFHTKPTEKALREFGTALFKALFSGYAGQLLQKTHPTHPNGRIFLQLNRCVELDAIPWEYAKYHDTFLVHQREFSRIHERPQDPIPEPLPLRVVVVVPDPIILPGEPGANLPDLHLSEQFQNFVNRFTKNKKMITLERVFPPTVCEVGALLNAKAAMSTVLHFMGHCGQENTSDPRALIFEHAETGRAEYVGASQLVPVFKYLRLAFLSACNSRDIARELVEHNIRYAIGSNCDLPDDVARKFESEFHKFLSNGSTIETAMHQARATFQISHDIRQNSYFAGAMILYSSTIDKGDSAFRCDEGDLVVDLHLPPSNLGLSKLDTTTVIRQRKKEFIELYSCLQKMVFKRKTSHFYTIKGIGGQEFVTEAMRRMAHLFPGGIFAWSFKTKITSAIEYYLQLVEVLFPKEKRHHRMPLMKRRSSSNVQELGLAIIQQLEKGEHATCLLILFHADILDLGEKEGNMHAIELGTWLRRVASESVKIVITSSEVLDWCATGEIMDLKDVMSPSIYNVGYEKGVHEYFGK